MIIVKIMGGLGNQMFQYAFGRNLAIKNKTELYLDIYSHQISSELGILQLDKFNSHYKLLSKLFYRFIRHKYTRKLLRSPIYNIKFVEQRKNKKFDPDLLNLRGNIYLSGYWQTEKYFESIRDILFEEFTLIQEPNRANYELLKDIRENESICLHIRRGDYINNKAINSFHGICDLDYYYKGIEYILHRKENTKIFIFSDDIEWCKKNIRSQQSHNFVNINTPEKGYEDLRLMYNCKHFIIANSSFSWWGAWLSKNPDKIVIAPNSWFADKKAQKYADCIVPDSYIRI
jgi:hypothetical protein